MLLICTTRRVNVVLPSHRECRCRARQANTSKSKNCSIAPWEASAFWILTGSRTKHYGKCFSGRSTRHALTWTSILRWITASLTVCTPFRQRDYMKKNNRGKDVAEKQLFHGTDRKHVDAICRNNFDWRICGTHGTAYGKGEVQKVMSSSKAVF